MTDFLTPAENCVKLHSGNLAYDVSRIRTAVENFTVDRVGSLAVREQYSATAATRRWLNFIASCSEFWEAKRQLGNGTA